MHVDRSAAKSCKASDFPLAWTEDGKSFVIRDQAALCADWLPAFFQQAKFSSFTRKLYRWGFRQIKYLDKPKPSLSGEIYFGNEYFQRDNKSLLARMHSVTAVKRKRQQETTQSGRSDVAAVRTTTELPTPAFDFTHFTQQPYTMEMNSSLVAQQAAFPVAGQPNGNTNHFDMTNVFAQQSYAQNQDQLQPQPNGSDQLVPHPIQYQDTSAAIISNEYLRLLAQLVNPPSDVSINSFPVPFQPTVPQMTMPQQAYGSSLQQPQVQATDVSDLHQQQLLQALQSMLDQSQQAGQQHLPPADDTQ
jgi:hypothetical protein